jgi:hypothetical protein
VYDGSRTNMTVNQSRSAALSRRRAATSAKCREETHAPQLLPALFDHLVGAQQERFRYREAKRLGGFEIHD